MPRQALIPVEQMREWVKTQPVGTVYCKCVVKQLDIFKGYYSEKPELWGYAKTDDIAKAKRLFSKAIDEGLDGYLNYGYMVIEQYAVTIDENGKRHGRRAATYINDFGKWKSKEQFVKDHLLKSRLVAEIEGMWKHEEQEEYKNR